MPDTLDLLRNIWRAPEMLRAARETPAFADLARRYLSSRPRPYPFRLRLRSGGELKLSDRAELTVFWQIFVHGCYKLPEACNTVLDCGANVGIFALWAARERPQARIVSLEPFPDTFSRLTSHVRHQGLDTRIKCVQVALAAGSGERQMAVGGDSPTRKLTDAHDSPAGGTVAVRCMTLADCLAEHQLETVDLLKMDIEGSEWEVLLSTPPEVLNRFRHVQVEYHEVHERFNYTPDRLFAHLAAAGHRLVSRIEDADRTGVASFESTTSARSKPRGRIAGSVPSIKKSAEAAP